MEYDSSGSLQLTIRIPYATDMADNPGSGVPLEPPIQMTPAEFLEKWPLYRRWTGKWNQPKTISLACDRCERETSWGTNFRNYSQDLSYISTYTYSCHLCNDRDVQFMIFASGEVHMKVGQFPAQSTAITPSIKKRLGDSAIFYRRALTCRNEGFGLGAVAYFRRVVEDKTNELIDVVVEYAAATGVPDSDIAHLKAAKSEKVYEDKLKIASEAIPSVMKPDGANPLRALYDLLSVGIHTQNEEECLQIADNVREIFDYLFDRLRAEVEDRKSFVTKLKKIAGNR